MNKEEHQEEHAATPDDGKTRGEEYNTVMGLDRAFVNLTLFRHLFHILART